MFKIKIDFQEFHLLELKQEELQQNWHGKLQKLYRKLLKKIIQGEKSTKEK